MEPVEKRSIFADVVIPLVIAMLLALIFLVVVSG